MKYLICSLFALILINGCQATSDSGSVAEWPFQYNFVTVGIDSVNGTSSGMSDYGAGCVKNTEDMAVKFNVTVSPRSIGGFEGAEFSRVEVRGVSATFSLVEGNIPAPTVAPYNPTPTVVIPYSTASRTVPVIATYGTKSYLPFQQLGDMEIATYNVKLTINLEERNSTPGIQPLRGVVDVYLDELFILGNNVSCPLIGEAN